MLAILYHNLAKLFFSIFKNIGVATTMPRPIVEITPITPLLKALEVTHAISSTGIS